MVMGSNLSSQHDVSGMMANATFGGSGCNFFPAPRQGMSSCNPGNRKMMPQAGLEVPEKQQQSCGLKSPGLGPSIAPVRVGFAAGNRKQMEYGEVAANIVSHRERGDSLIVWSICSCPGEGMRLM